MTRRKRRITRSVILFSVGMAGIALETYWSLRFHQTPDSTLVLLFSAMMGLPVYLREDARRNDDDDRGDDVKPPVDHAGRKPSEPAD